MGAFQWVPVFHDRVCAGAPGAHLLSCPWGVSPPLLTGVCLLGAGLPPPLWHPPWLCLAGPHGLLLMTALDRGPLLMEVTHSFSYNSSPGSQFWGLAGFVHLGCLHGVLVLLLGGAPVPNGLCDVRVSPQSPWVSPSRSGVDPLSSEPFFSHEGCLNWMGFRGSGTGYMLICAGCCVCTCMFLAGL